MDRVSPPAPVGRRPRPAPAGYRSCYDLAVILLLAACSESVALAPHSSSVLAPVPSYTPVDTGTAVDTEVDSGSEPEPPDEEEDVELPRLVINEVQTKNASTLLVSGNFPDWIEVYNDSAESVDYGRIQLIDENDLPWIGPAGTSLDPGQFLLVYADGSLAGGVHAPFSLDGDGDSIVLKVDGYPVDRIATGDFIEDASWARFPDGGTWAPTIECTPGGSNGAEPSATLDLGDTLFDLSGDQDINLIMETSAINSLTANSYAEVQADININGTEFGPVDLRIRGSATRQPFTGKASLKVDLNSYLDIKYRDLEKLTLINMIWDASYVREYVGYALFREAGVPAARTSYAYVSVNDDLMGYYLFTETYDDAFLRLLFGNDDGYLWEGSGDFGSYSSWDCEEGFPCDTSVLRSIYSIIQSGSGTDAEMAELETYVNLDNLMREWILENAIGQWDGYTSPHNFRVYWNPDDGLIYMIPSSIDYTFDNPYSFSENIFYGNGAMMRWCWNATECKDRYKLVALEVADMIDDMDWDTRLDELYAHLEDKVGRDQDDPRGNYTKAQFDTSFDYIRTYMAEIPGVIRGQAM